MPNTWPIWPPSIMTRGKMNRRNFLKGMLTVAGLGASGFVDARYASSTDVAICALIAIDADAINLARLRGSSCAAGNDVGQDCLVFVRAGLEDEVRKLPGFMGCEFYCTRRMLSEMELGTAGQFRFIRAKSYSDIAVFAKELNITRLRWTT